MTASVVSVARGIFHRRNGDANEVRLSFLFLPILWWRFCLHFYTMSFHLLVCVLMSGLSTSIQKCCSWSEVYWTCRRRKPFPSMVVSTNLCMFRVLSREKSQLFSDYFVCSLWKIVGICALRCAQFVMIVIIRHVCEHLLLCTLVLVYIKAKHPHSRQICKLGQFASGEALLWVWVHGDGASRDA